MIKLLIADDHPLMAEGIRQVFTQDEEISVVGVVSNGLEALRLIGQGTIDVALLDIDMPEMDGIQCARQVIDRYPGVQVAMLTMHQERSLVLEMVEVGVKGFLLKTVPGEELIFAVKSIYKGGSYFNADITKALMAKNQQVEQISEELQLLSGREIEILKLIASGMSNPQIGEQLFISPKTVDVHRTNLMRKINVNNVAGVVRFAFKHGLVD